MCHGCYCGNCGSILADLAGPGHGIRIWILVWSFEFGSGIEYDTLLLWMWILITDIFDNVSLQFRSSSLQ
jgi:hypothetical protein